MRPKFVVERFSAGFSRRRIMSRPALKRSTTSILVLAAFALSHPVIAEPPGVVSPLITTNGVTFSCYDTNAFSVSVAGEFNQWNINANLMERSKRGVWSTTVQIKPGKYLYQFNVNGIHWQPDPNNPNKSADNYGGLRSMLEVPEQIARPAATGTNAPAGPKVVKFAYFNPLAKSVAVAGYFNRWSRTANPMTKDEHGTWTVVVQLKPGNHAYKFLVDGKWETDSANPITVDDTEGGKNSVKLVEP